MMSPTENIRYYFFLGTEAELIKMTSVIKIFQQKKVPFKIISTGQNDIRKSTMLEYLGIKTIDIVLYDKPVFQSPLGLLFWCIRTLAVSIFALRKELSNRKAGNSWLIVHGDTVTSAMGSIAGRMSGMKVAHIEAGYHSSSLFHPFPEELDRAIASRFADVLFCPWDSIGKIYPTHKISINTGLNTSIDSLHIALKTPNTLRLNERLKGKKYFIFALHRQETLINTELVKNMINFLINLKTDLYCVFAFHNPTFKVLKDLGLLEKLEQNRHIITSPRLPYFEYVHLLNKSEFIMTDGVGNQQETYYLGKPCLILRHVVEGAEGMKGNALLSRNDPEIIRKFVAHYQKYRRLPLSYTKSPSVVISEYLLDKQNCK
jgi:UDP-N-acetylglucosamine 2-epimerase (non-hydrolysing)